MANGKKAFAKGRQFLAATGIISSDDSVEVDENVPGGNVDDDASTEFFRSMPGYKPNVQKKKTVPLAKPDFVEQQISSILARNPGICFDRAIIKDRDQARDAIAGRKRKELERHQNTMVALNTEGAFNDGGLRNGRLKSVFDQSESQSVFIAGMECSDITKSFIAALKHRHIRGFVRLGTFQALAPFLDQAEIRRQRHAR